MKISTIFDLVSPSGEVNKAFGSGYSSAIGSVTLRMKLNESGSPFTSPGTSFSFNVYAYSMTSAAGSEKYDKLFTLNCSTPETNVSISADDKNTDYSIDDPTGSGDYCNIIIRVPEDGEIKINGICVVVNGDTPEAILEE